MEFIRNFNKLGKHDAAIAGGKGASLGEMTQAGIPVPPGFVILSESFEKMEPIDGMKKTLHETNDNEFFIITSRPKKFEKITVNHDNRNIMGTNKVNLKNIQVPSAMSKQLISKKSDVPETIKKAQEMQKDYY